MVVVAVEVGFIGRVVVAIAGGLLILWLGTVFLRGFARPRPEPPPPGELRRVHISYRCDICGTEVRVMVANDEVPEAPRHCSEEMTLVAPRDE